MPELPVRERLSELHLPEFKRDDIVRTLSEIRLPSVDLSSVELPGRQRDARRFDWRSIDLSGALAGAAAIGRLGRPLMRRRATLVAGAVVVVVGVVTAAALANPTVRERAGRQVRRVRDRIETRTGSASDVELDDDVDRPAGGELVSDEAPLETLDPPPVGDAVEGDARAWDSPEAPMADASDTADEAVRPA
jgi:hypothetical protein